MERMSPSSVADTVADTIIVLRPCRTAAAPPFAGATSGEGRGGGPPALPGLPFGRRSAFGRSASVPEDYHDSNRYDDDDDDASFSDELDEIERRAKLERTKNGGDKTMGPGAAEEEEEGDDELFGTALSGLSVGVPRETARGSGGRREDPGRKMSKSMGNREPSLFEVEMSSDEGEAHATWKKKKKGKGNNKKEKRRYKSVSNHDPTLFEDDLSDDEEDGEESREATSEGENELRKMTACSLEVNFGFKHDDEDMDIVRKNSDSHSVDTRVMSGNKDRGFAIPDPKVGRRRVSADEAPSRPLPSRGRPARERWNALLSRRCSAAKEQGQWRPLSSDNSPKKDGDRNPGQWRPPSSDDSSKRDEDRNPEEEDRKKRTKKNFGRPEQGGIGSLWNKLTSPLTSESGPIIEPELLANEAPARRKKEVDGATYFRRGKRKMAKDDYLQAVVLFNFALVHQREELGENHIDCGTTLNEIGVCWTVMGERYPALTAFKEALYIRQKRLGDGAMEAAETTNNIWMILHEERCELEDGIVEEKGGKDEEDRES